MIHRTQRITLANIRFSDIGAHVDGFPAVAGHTLVIGASPDKKVAGRRADVIMAAHYAAEAMLRLVKPGGEVSDHKPPKCQTVFFLPLKFAKYNLTV